MTPFIKYALAVALVGLGVTGLIFGLAIWRGLNPLVTVHVLNFLIMSFSLIMGLWLYRIKYPGEEKQLSSNLLFGLVSYGTYTLAIAGSYYLALTLHPEWLQATRDAAQNMMQGSRELVIEKAGETFYNEELAAAGRLTAEDIAADALKRLIIWMILVVPVASLLVGLMSRKGRTVASVG